MKNFKFILLFLAFIATGTLVSSCGDSATDKTENADKQGKEYTSAYVCPMHCEGSGSEEPGKCPVCKMDYVVNEDHQGDGHNHDDHEGHTH